MSWETFCQLVLLMILGAMLTSVTASYIIEAKAKVKAATSKERS